MARFSQQFINDVCQYNDDNEEIIEWVDPERLADYLEKKGWVLWYKYDPKTETIVETFR